MQLLTVVVRVVALLRTRARLRPIAIARLGAIAVTRRLRTVPAARLSRSIATGRLRTVSATGLARSVATWRLWPVATSGRLRSTATRRLGAIASSRRLRSATARWLRTIAVARRLRARRLRPVAATRRLRTTATRWTNRWTWPHRWPCGRPDRDRPSIPAIAVAIERAVEVVAGPVSADHERDNRNANLAAVIRHVHRLAVVHVGDIGASHPAAIRSDDDIAPFPSGGAALYGNPGIGGQDLHDRIIGIRTGTHIHIGNEIAVRGENRGGNHHQQGGHEGPEHSFHRAILQQRYGGGRTTLMPVHHGPIQGINAPAAVPGRTPGRCPAECRYLRRVRHNPGVTE